MDRATYAELLGLSVAGFAKEAGLTPLSTDEIERFRAYARKAISDSELLKFTLIVAVPVLMGLAWYAVLWLGSRADEIRGWREPLVTMFIVLWMSVAPLLIGTFAAKRAFLFNVLKRLEYVTTDEWKRVQLDTCRVEKAAGFVALVREQGRPMIRDELDHCVRIVKAEHTSGGGKKDHS